MSEATRQSHPVTKWYQVSNIYDAHPGKNPVIIKLNNNSLILEYAVTSLIRGRTGFDGGIDGLSSEPSCRQLDKKAKP